MANNVAITAGSGTTVGTDDCGGVHISLVKLVDSTEDSTTRTGIAASPLQVSLANTGANSNALVVASHAVTNAGTFAVQVSSALPAGTNNIGDVDVLSCALPTGASTSANQTTIIGHLDGVEGLLTTIDADTGSISIDTGIIKTSIGAIETDIGSIDGKITACNTGAVVLAAGTANIGDVDVLSLPSLPAGTNNIGDVDIVSGTITTVTTLTGGGVAHDSADSGNPHKLGAVAYSPDGTTPGTAVAEGDRTNLKADLDGRLFVSADHPRRGHKHLDGSSAYTDEVVVADPGDGFQVVITAITVSTGAATALNFFLEEGSTKIFGPIYLEAVAGRGFTQTGMYLPVTASTAVTITTSAAIAQSIDIDYFIQAV